MEDLFDEIEDIEIWRTIFKSYIQLEQVLDYGKRMKEIKKGISPFKDLITLMSDLV